MSKIYTILFFVSISLAATAVVLLMTYGLQFGVDFKGGSVLELHFSNRPSVDDLKTVLTKNTDIKDFETSPVGDNGLVIKTRELSEAEHQAILSAINKNFPSASVSEVKFDSVGPIVGNELKNKSIKAIVVVLLAISAYIAFVFRKLSRALSPWVMSLATMAALAHDILLPLGVFSLLGHFHGVEISAVFVAAVLTVLGYSISDTVIVFDRVRENIIRGELLKNSFDQVVHKSIMQTLVRSINTNMTTLLSLVAIYFFGGESIKYFALALIVGIFSGAYSSIFVASPILVWVSKKHR